MKHLKSHETKSNYKFKIGQKIICINDDWPITFLKKDKSYIVVDRRTYMDINYYSISNNNNIIKNHKNEPSFYGEKVFLSVLEYKAKKYNL